MEPSFLLFARIDVSWRADDAGDPTRLIFDWRERGGAARDTSKAQGIWKRAARADDGFRAQGQDDLDA
jgi:hypothetical protein